MVIVMFNSYSNSVKINAVTGSILKNHPKSWFETFHLRSKRADVLLNPNGCKDLPYSQRRGVTVLQMVVCGDMEVIAECVYTEDFMEVSDDNQYI